MAGGYPGWVRGRPVGNQAALHVKSIIRRLSVDANNPQGQLAWSVAEQRVMLSGPNRRKLQGAKTTGPGT